VRQRLKKAFLELGMTYNQFLSTVNEKYTSRWDMGLSKISFSEDQLKFLRNNFASLNILIFACDFCPDCQNSIPILHKMAEFSDFISLKIVDRDADKDLFKHFFLNNKALIPTVLFLNQEFHEVGRWVERSTFGYQLIYESKRLAEGKTNNEFLQIKNNNFKSNSRKLFQENVNEIFNTLQRAVYIINTALIDLK
jgi:thiol-disulfide isomerase/thioredoxin